MFHNVCRLCLGTGDLIWIFNERMANNMPEIIQVTSGVEISKSDAVTQMVCSTCCQITIKMFKFRTTSIKNDKDLKAKCAGYNVSQLVNSVSHTAQEEAPKLIVTASSVSSDSTTSANTSVNTTGTNNSNTLKSPVPKFQIPIKYKSAHPSIKQILKEYPSIKLPEISLNAHVGAYITLLTDEVDEWFKERLLTVEQIAQIKKSAAEYSRTLESTKSSRRQQRKRRKSSTGSRSSSTSKTSNSPNAVANNAKRTKVNEECASKPMFCVKTSTPNPITKFNFHNTVTLTNASFNENSNTPVTPKPSINSNLTINTSVKPSVVLSDKANRQVRTQTVVQSASTTNVNVSLVNSSTVNRSVLGSLLQDKSVCPKDNEITLSSLLQSSKSTGKNILEAVDDSDQDDDNDPSYDPSYDPGDDESDVEVEKLNIKSSTRSKRPVKIGDHEQLPKDKIPHPIHINRSFESNNREENLQTLKSNESELHVSNNKQNEQTLKNKEAPCKNRTPDNLESKKLPAEKKPTEDYTLFTTRPFLRTGGGMPKPLDYKFRVEVCDTDGELLVLYDSDDDDCPNTKKPSSDTDVNTCNPNTMTNSSDSAEANKNASSLVDIQDSSSEQPNNAPDLSLVSLANKTFTLYICKVCDSHCSSLKDLKNHERKTHTKCPFCNKKFRSLASRDEHVKHTCIINDSRFSLKVPKLALRRIDEVEEIRKKYAYAFEDVENICAQDVTENVTVLSQVSGATRLPLESPKCNVNVETTDAVKELELFLQDAPIHSRIDHPKDSLSEKSTDNTATGDIDIVCISDDENSTISKFGCVSNSKIEVVNNDILKSINTLDNDVNIFKNILSQFKANRYEKVTTLETLKENGITDGITPRVKIFKNLRKHLQYYKIPIEINYNTDLKVEYKHSKHRPTRKNEGLWNNMVPQDIIVPNTSFISDKPLNKPIIIKEPCTSVQNSESVLCPRLSNGSQNVSIAERVTTCSTNNIANKSTKLNAINSKIQSTGLILQAYSNSISRNVVPYEQIGINSTSAILNSTTVNASHTAVPNTAVILRSNANSISQNVITSEPVNKGQITQFGRIEGNALVTSTASFIAHPSIVSSHITDHTYTSVPYTNSPLILNGTQTLCTSSTNTNFTNIILVPSTMLQTDGNANATEFPTTQGPLPVIQSVTTAVEEFSAASNGSNVSVCTSTNSDTAQPTIRVKNLSELS